MTREEAAEAAWQSYLIKNNFNTGSSKNCFIEGIWWADLHPARDPQAMWNSWAQAKDKDCAIALDKMLDIALEALKVIVDKCPDQAFGIWAVANKAQDEINKLRGLEEGGGE